MSRASAHATQLASPPEDGRTARGRRTREAVVEAVVALLKEGDVRPTAARVAERAGVSLRSVFQHFADLEDLFATVADRQFAVTHDLPPAADPADSLEARIAAFGARRAELLERLTPIRRAAALQEPFSAVVHDRLERTRAAGATELERVFQHELDRLPADIRAETLASLRLATAWTAWENLRREQGLSKAAAARVYRRTLHAVLQAALAELRDEALTESIEA